MFHTAEGGGGGGGGGGREREWERGRVCVASERKNVIEREVMKQRKGLCRSCERKCEGQRQRATVTQLQTERERGRKREREREREREPKRQRTRERAFRSHIIVYLNIKFD